MYTNKGGCRRFTLKKNHKKLVFFLAFFKLASKQERKKAIWNIHAKSQPNRLKNDILNPFSLYKHANKSASKK
jgi:hypothetical protein